MAVNTDLYTKGKEEIVFTKKTISVGVDIKEGKIVNIYPSSEFMGYLFTGDIIDSVCGQKVVNTPEFIKAVTSRVPGKIVIEYRRDEHCTYHLKPLPARKNGFEMFEITLVWRTGGTPLGLLIHRDFTGQIIVAMVETGSMASRTIRPGDSLIKVNTKEINDKDVARKLIMDSINATKKVTLVLERPNPKAVVPAEAGKTPPPPSTMAATSAAAALAPPPKDYTPTIYGAPPPAPCPAPSVLAPVPSATSCVVAPYCPPVNKTVDVVLPADVLAIMEANKGFYKVKCTQPPCLKRFKEPTAAARADMPPTAADESTIPFDQSPKPLKITPKRVGS